MKNKMPKSTRKFIRRQKAQIRRQFFDVKKQEELINLMLGKINKRNAEILSEKSEK